MGRTVEAHTTPTSGPPFFALLLFAVTHRAFSAECSETARWRTSGSRGVPLEQSLHFGFGPPGVRVGQFLPFFPEQTPRMLKANLPKEEGQERENARGRQRGRAGQDTISTPRDMMGPITITGRSQSGSLPCQFSRALILRSAQTRDLLSRDGLLTAQVAVPAVADPFIPEPYPSVRAGLSTAYSASAISPSTCTRRG